jgi:DNA-binding response OmpR family regulator
MGEHQNSTPPGYASEYPETLVISPDIALTQFLTEGLLEHGFWVSAVRSGLQALEVFRVRGFDLLLIDAAVSDLPLDELLQRLRTPGEEGESLPRQSLTIPVVVIAGSDMELEAYDLSSQSPDAIFVAPFELQDLADALKALHRRR